MAILVSDVIALMDVIAPRWMGCANDPGGLHAGDPTRRVKKILLALDATHPVIAEAKRAKAQMVITHHPRFYRPLASLDETTLAGKLAAEIARARLAVYCAHTNLDVAPGGVNDVLADLVGLADRQPIEIVATDARLKLVVFVPDSYHAHLRTAVCEAGAGIIGEYADCSFRTRGTGTFRGSDMRKPYAGNAEVFEEVEEWRLEVCLPESIRPAVEAALRAAHPYEEPAYDMYTLVGAERYGLGRVGTLAKETTLGALAKKMKRQTRSPGTLVLGEANQKIKTVAVWSGAAFPVARAAELDADCVVTGEIGYHDTEVLMHAGVGCIMLGHAPCEEIVLPSLRDNLAAALPEISIEIAQSKSPVMWSA